ncbi:MAG: MFS transporter [Candidatus Lokiarchaeota archaeon]|nr:MFS transporter [Candidatus Lokiarchaeota archaeon]
MNSISKNRELHGKRLIGYASANFGISLVNIFTGTFVFQFYVYTINLSSILVSAGLTINFVLIAVFSIISGVIADNKKPGKRGKRKYFLIIGLPIWLLANIFLWLPPWYCPPSNSFFLPTALYFWSMISIKAIFGTIIFTTYLSMLPEQSQTSENRKKVASIRVIFSIIASVLALLMPLAVQSLLEDPINAKWWTNSGGTVIVLMPIIGISFALFGSITIIFTYFSVDESFHNHYEMKNEKKKIKNAFKAIFYPLTDRNYNKLLLVQFFVRTAGKILGILIIPLITYVLLFRNNDFYIYIIVSITGKLTWYFFWRYFFKNKTLITKYALCLWCAGIGSIFIIIFIIPLTNFLLTVILFFLTEGTILGALYAFPLFSIPLGANLVHNTAKNIDSESSDRALSSLSGAYYGALNFISSMGQTCGSLIVGAILIGPNEKNPIIIVILYSSIGTFYLISIIFLKKISPYKEPIDVDIDISLTIG